MTGAEMLRVAAQVVDERRAVYGPPDRNFATIALIWTAHLRARGLLAEDAAITPADVAAMSAGIKLARLGQSPDHGDSWLDLAGYAACGADVSGA